MLLVDTAGIHATNDLVERIGVERAREALEDAVIQLIVLDRSVPLTDDDLTLVRQAVRDRAILVLNKSDLAVKWDLPCVPSDVLPCAVVTISALTGEGLADLEQALAVMALRVSGAVDENEIVLAIPRHVELLSRAKTALGNTLDAVRMGQPGDVAAGELAIASRALGEITGVNATEDLLDTIFSRFCLGK
jgi:tRNA modification GTPase